MANISCADAATLIAEAQGASCMSPRERNLLEIGLLWDVAYNLPSSSISCEQANLLIAEASKSGCRSPREKKLIEIGLLWQAANLIGLLGVLIYITADNAVITSDNTVITADMVEFN